jgi:hypothetical protein
VRTELNLASKPLLNTTPLLVLLAVLAAAAAGLTAWNGGLWLNTRAETRAVESQLLALEREEQALLDRRTELTRRLQRTDLEALSRRVAAANAVLAEKSVSWSLLLERLQEVTPWDVRLDAIRTSVGEDGVRLSLELRTPKADYYWDMIQRLEEHPCFSNVYPSNQDDTDGGELDVFLQLDHDPWCGRPNPNPQGAERRRRGGRRG